MTRQQRNEIIQKLEVLAKEQTEIHRRQMARIKNLVKVLETNGMTAETHRNSVDNALQRVADLSAGIYSVHEFARILAARIGGAWLPRIIGLSVDARILAYTNDSNILRRTKKRLVSR